MIKLVKEERKTILMEEMKPLQVGKIVLDTKYGDRIVMRTSSTSHFEVMDLSNPGEDVCWTSDTGLQVELFSSHEKVVFEIFNGNEED